MKHFAGWLAASWPSLLIQRNEVWVIPLTQSIHIMAVGIVLASALMLTLRLTGTAGTDLSLLQVQQRFGPWLTGALGVLLLTGIVLIVGEPARELLAFSFWLKMVLVACGAVLSRWFQRSVQAQPDAWESRLSHLGSVRTVACAALLIWIAIVFLGRFIAYDHIWGALSGSTRA